MPCVVKILRLVIFLQGEGLARPDHPTFGAFATCTRIRSTSAPSTPGGSRHGAARCDGSAGRPTVTAACARAAVAMPAPHAGSVSGDVAALTNPSDTMAFYARPDAGANPSRCLMISCSISARAR